MSKAQIVTESAMARIRCRLPNIETREHDAIYDSILEQMDQLFNEVANRNLVNLGLLPLTTCHHKLETTQDGAQRCEICGESIT